MDEWRATIHYASSHSSLEGIKLSIYQVGPSKVQC